MGILIHELGPCLYSGRFNSNLTPNSGALTSSRALESLSLTLETRLVNDTFFFAEHPPFGAVFPESVGNTTFVSFFFFGLGSLVFFFFGDFAVPKLSEDSALDFGDFAVPEFLEDLALEDPVLELTFLCFLRLEEASPSATVSY